MEKSLKIFNIGMRAVKTALAVSISMWIGHSLDLTTPLLAGISAIISIQTYIYETLEVSINRILSTCLGALIAVVFFYIGFTNYLAIFVGTFLIIALCIKLSWHKAIALSCIVFLIIILYDQAEMDIVDYALHRLLDTAVGLTIGFLVNYFIYPNNPEKYILRTYETTLKDCYVQLKKILIKDPSLNVTGLISNINTISTNYKTLRRDTKLMMNSPVDIINIEDINKKFLIVTSSIEQLTTLPEHYHLSLRNLNALEKIYGEEYRKELDGLEKNIQRSEVNEETNLVFNFHVDYSLRTLGALCSNIEKLKKLYSQF